MDASLYFQDSPLHTYFVHAPHISPIHMRLVSSYVNHFSIPIPYHLITTITPSPLIMTICVFAPSSTLTSICSSIVHLSTRSPIMNSFHSHILMQPLTLFPLVKGYIPTLSNYSMPPTYRRSWTHLPSFSFRSLLPYATTHSAPSTEGIHTHTLKL